MIVTRLQLFLLPLALCGFAIAQPVYNLLLQTPVFLVARQNTQADVWALVLLLSFVLPVVLVLPAWLTHRRWPVFHPGGAGQSVVFLQLYLLPSCCRQARGPFGCYTSVWQA